MKRIFAVAAALCLLAGTNAFAQKQHPNHGTMSKERPTAEQVAQRQTDRLTKELGLDATQAKQVYALNLHQVQQMQAVREQMRKDRIARGEKMKSLLTPEQYAKWSQMQGPKPGEHRGKMGKAGCCAHKGDCKDGKAGCCSKSEGGCKEGKNGNCKDGKNGDCKGHRPAQAGK